MRSGLSGFVYLAGLEKPAQVIFEARGMFAREGIPASCHC